MKVWDPLVRVLHWSLAASVAAAWITTERLTRFHELVGYIALAAVLLRVLIGFIGSPYARFGQFVRSLRHTAAYTAKLLRRAEPRYIGHNPLGGWMVVAMLACTVGTAATGWLFTTDRYWGDDLMQTLHSTLAWSLVALIALHVSGVLFTSFRHRENLVRAMLSGIKRAPEERDIR